MNYSVLTPFTLAIPGTVLRGQGAWDVTDLPQSRLPKSAETGAGIGPDQLTVEFPGPLPQYRLTILARLVLVIPQLIALWMLGVAAEAVVVVGWFGALFTGRLPDFAAEYLSGYLRWQTRVYGYLLLLTGQYPPFSLEDDDYPVRLRVLPGRLNRLAVLFRVVLAVPAMAVTGVLWFGLCLPVLFIIWVVVLFTGTMPATVHQALAATARYFVRFAGYMLLLTSEYPKGLFGDRPDPASPRLLVLSEAAKRLVGVFVGVGIAGLACYVALVAAMAATAASGPAPTRASAFHQVRGSYATLNRTLRSLGPKTAGCASRSDPLGCVTAVDRSVADAFAAFDSTLRTTPMPSAAATAAAGRLATAAEGAEQVFLRLGSATTPAQYTRAAAGSNVGRIIDQVGMDYMRLALVLNPP
jgi:hypothetical protein